MKLLVGREILMVKPGHATPVERGQKGRITDFDAQNLYHIRWDDGRQSFFPGNGDEIALMRDDVVCDFCSATPVAWTCHVRHDRVEAHAIMTGPRGQNIDLGMATQDDWAACDPCRKLIEADSRQALLVRSAKRMKRKHGTPMKVGLRLVGGAHGAFWTVFNGKITPHTPEEG